MGTSLDTNEPGYESSGYEISMTGKLSKSPPFFQESAKRT